MFRLLRKNVPWA